MLKWRSPDEFGLALVCSLDVVIELSFETAELADVLPVDVLDFPLLLDDTSPCLAAQSELFVREHSDVLIGQRTLGVEDRLVYIVGLQLWLENRVVRLLLARRLLILGMRVIHLCCLPIRNGKELVASIIWNLRNEFGITQGLLGLVVVVHVQVMLV